MLLYTQNNDGIFEGHGLYAGIYDHWTQLWAALQTVTDSRVAWISTSHNNTDEPYKAKGSFYIRTDKGWQYLSPSVPGAA